MPVTAKASTRTPSRTSSRKPPATTSAVVKPPLPHPLMIPDGRPTQHKGIAVVQEVLRSNLPNGAPMKISKLKLADGTEAAACRDCTHTGDTIKDVMVHRYNNHAANYGKKFARVITQPDKFVGDIVPPARKPDSPKPAGAMEMTMAEVLALLPSIYALGELIERVEHERDLMAIELNERRKHDRENAQKIAAYDALTEEVVERRMAMKTTGSYEQMRVEVTELRAWKKKMITKLSALGFTLTDEES